MFYLFNSTFAHIPPHGLVVTATTSLKIRDCTFSLVHPKSLVIENTKSVEVINNQFSINTIQVISYKDVSSLFISCNRLPVDQYKPECTDADATDDTTFLARQATDTKDTPDTITTTNQRQIEEHSSLNALISGLIVITIFVSLSMLVIVLLCVRNWEIIKNEIIEVVCDTRENIEPLKVYSIPAPPPPPPPVEMQTLLHSQHSTKQELFTPVWLEEIQINKIFTKQKSINEETEESENTDPATDYKKADNMNERHIRENSRTESDQEVNN